MSGAGQAGTAALLPSGVGVDGRDVTQAVVKGPIGEEATVLRTTGYQVFRWLWLQCWGTWSFCQGLVACVQRAEGQSVWVWVCVCVSEAGMCPIWSLSCYGPFMGVLVAWVERRQCLALQRAQGSWEDRQPGLVRPSPVFDCGIDGEREGEKEGGKGGGEGWSR